MCIYLKIYKCDASLVVPWYPKSILQTGNSFYHLNEHFFVYHNFEMPSVNKMLLPLLTALLPFSSVWSLPTKPSILSIPVRDIIRNDLSAYEAHPNFKLYSLWLETPPGSYIGRDPKAAFTKHSNIIAIDCHSDLATCLLTSRVPFADITKSKRELDRLNGILEEQLQARDEEDPAALFARVVEEHSNVEKRSSLEKRYGLANTLYSSTHIKTYHDLGEENPVAGFQHYIVWDLKVCRLRSQLDVQEKVE